MTSLVDDHLYRQKQILGDPKANPPIDPIIPVSPSTWWLGIKKGIYPAGIKLSTKVTAWKGKDLRRIVEGEGVG
ncbi:MAG: hypothetical protein JKY88_06650 [Pseudomonadales bacterium]|nr:hypothetical protein [Pseudomonadales bacterium]